MHKRHDKCITENKWQQGADSETFRMPDILPGCQGSIKNAHINPEGPRCTWPAIQRCGLSCLPLQIMAILLLCTSPNLGILLNKASAAGPAGLSTLCGVEALTPSPQGLSGRLKRPAGRAHDPPVFYLNCSDGPALEVLRPGFMSHRKLLSRSFYTVCNGPGVFL